MSDRWGAAVARSLAVLFLGFLVIVGAQALKSSELLASDQSPPSGSAQGQAPGRDGQTKDKPPGEAQSPSDTQQPAESKITPQQAQELFRDVDTILNFASQDTALPKRRDVKRRLANRDEVVSYLRKNMAEDKDVQRLRRTELVLKKFGLLPKDFDLQTFLVSLLEEQVAGYYDAKTKTVNLLDWVVPDLQRPVLAHELTHALQDQSFGLDRWLRKGTEDLDSKKKITPDDIVSDENSEARQAVVEGQAMVVLLDYMLAPMHRTVADSPEIVSTLNEDMRAGTPDSVQYRNAPIFLKESLTFPYRYGVEFVAELLRRQGKAKAFEVPFQNPPRTSREIMEPETYLAGEHLAPLPLPDFKKIFSGYERFDIGAIGEFDVAVLAEQYVGEAASHRIYPNWRGGYYYSMHSKQSPSGPLALVFVSRWASAKWAQQFAAMYARGIQQRYKKMESEGQSSLPSNLENLESLGGNHTWSTEEGPVTLDVRGDTVLVIESLDPSISREFQQAVFGPGSADH